MPLSTFTGGGYLPAVMLGLGLGPGLGLGLVRVGVRVVLARVRVSWPAVMLPVSQVTTVRVSMAPSLSAW